MSIKVYNNFEIINLYNSKVLKDSDYFKKYENLDSYRDGIIEEMF